MIGTTSLIEISG